MGALHRGHLALVEHAHTLADRVIATLFVNPTQFGPNEDLDRYPRQEQSDLDAFEKADVATVFMPAVEEMYAPGDATRIDVAGPALGLEADHRPHFFGGVATVVSRLLLAAMCDTAIFGEKDYQQLLVIRRMVADLKIPCEIHGGVTVREADGLALSSRNAYLTKEERDLAPSLYRTLLEARDAFAGGGAAPVVEADAKDKLGVLGFRPDYVSVCNAHDLTDITEPGRARILAAAWLGTTRLIDNVPA